MEDLVEKLKYLDIPKREGEVYLALLQKNEFTAPEISKVTSVTRTKSYEILQNLVKKGLCNESYRNGIKVFSCVEPKVVIENILTEFDNKKRVAEQLQISLTDLSKRNDKVDYPLEYIEVLTERSQIRDKWLTIEHNTKKELLVFTKPPYAQVKLENNIKELTPVLKNKTTVKSIYEYKQITSPEELKHLIETIETYQKMGEEVRIIEELPMKLCISDEKITMLSLNDRISLEPSITTIIIDHPNFAVAQKKVFESYWASAMNIEDFKKNQTNYFNPV
jgi:HTH-type transcriptional regulator, sugar sensing transcriptional regulator